MSTWPRQFINHTSTNSHLLIGFYVDQSSSKWSARTCPWERRERNSGCCLASFEVDQPLSLCVDVGRDKPLSPFSGNTRLESCWSSHQSGWYSRDSTYGWCRVYYPVSLAKLVELWLDQRHRMDPVVCREWLVPPRQEKTEVRKLIR